MGNENGDPQDFRKHELYPGHSVHVRPLQRFSSGLGHAHCRCPNALKPRSELDYVRCVFDFIQKRTDHATLLAAVESRSVSSVFSSRIPHVVREEIALGNPLELVEGGKSFNQLNLYT